MQSSLNRLLRIPAMRFRVTPCGGWVTRLRCRRGNALRWGLGIRGIVAMRPLCGIQHGGNRKSQGALARLCEFPGISPPKSPKNPITPIETSRDTLHPGTGVTTRTNRPAGRVRGAGVTGRRLDAAFAESGTLRSLILAFFMNRFAIRVTGVTMGLPPHTLPEGVTPSDSLLRFAAVSSNWVVINQVKII